MLKILDNFLPIYDFNILQKKVFGNKFPWYYNSTIAKHKEGIDQYQFTHEFFSTKNPYLQKSLSPHCSLIEPILIKLQPQHLLRVKANLRPRTATHVYSEMHVDLDMNQLTAIYYFNTSNGWTEFEACCTKIDSIANRMVIFSGDKVHCGTSCTDQHARVVLNINYIPGITFDDIPYIPD